MAWCSSLTYGREWFVQPTHAPVGDGLYEGLQWLGARMEQQ